MGDEGSAAAIENGMGSTIQSFCNFLPMFSVVAGNGKRGNGVGIVCAWMRIRTWGEIMAAASTSIQRQ